MRHDSNLELSELCQLRLCGCGQYYLTIGTVTLKLSQEMLKMVSETVNVALKEGVLVDGLIRDGVWN